MDSGPRAEEDKSMRFQTRLTPEMLDRYTRSGYWRGETCYDILSRRAAAHPDRVAIVDRGRRITYRDLKARVGSGGRAPGRPRHRRRRCHHHSAAELGGVRVR